MQLTTSSRDPCLRRTDRHDEAELFALFCEPLVYRYLGDGVAPPLSLLQDWLRKSDADFAEYDIGMWVLIDDSGTIVGCVRLDAGVDAEATQRSAELTYLLHPRVWRQGLATRMSWTVLQHAFATGKFNRIVAGADGPNLQSVEVMKRLGMHFARFVIYPLGQGVEYWLDGPVPPMTRVPVLPLMV